MTGGPLRPVALALVAVLLVTACAGAPVSCPVITGGDPGSLVQLRGVRFGDDSVSLLFGLRGGAPYGIPPFTVERAGDLVRVRLSGARSFYPDGTPSLRGPRDLTAPAGGMGTVSVRDEADGSVAVDIRAGRGGCPRVRDRRYILGTTHPAALIAVALHDGPVFVVDPDRGPAGWPTQVVGLGFTPSSPVAFLTGGRTVWTSRTDAKGWLDTTFYLPDADGSGLVVARDAARAATAHFRVER